MAMVTTICPICRKSNTMEVDGNAYFKFMNGAHVQDAFPTMPAADRERLVSGICPECWDKMFGEEDE